MAVDDVYTLTITAQGPNGYMMNDYAFIRTNATEPGLSDFQTLADYMKEINRVQQSDAVTYRTWRARQVRGSNVTWPTGADCNPVGGNLFEGTFTGTTIGGNSGDPLPWQCALVVTHKSSQVGRRHRGRTYVFGLLEVGQNGGTWLSLLLTPLTTAWQSFYTAYTTTAPTSGFKFGIWSYRTASGCAQNPSGKGHIRVDSPAPAMAFTAAASPLLRPTVYTQRRRVSGVGR